MGLSNEGNHLSTAGGLAEHNLGMARRDDLSPLLLSNFCNQTKSLSLSEDFEVGVRFVKE